MTGRWLLSGLCWYRDYGIFRIAIEPAAAGFRADAMLNTGKADSAVFKVGIYPNIDTAKAQAPRDMRAQILESLTEITEGQ